MSQEATARLLKLPVEMLHRLFDEIDGTTLLFSVRNVCQQLRAATFSYPLYTLDFASLSKPDFCQLLLDVRPERVTTLSLSDETWKPSRSVFSLAGRHRYLHATVFVDSVEYQLGTPARILLAYQAVFTHFSHSQSPLGWVLIDRKSKVYWTSLVSH